MTSLMNICKYTDVLLLKGTKVGRYFFFISKLIRPQVKYHSSTYQISFIHISNANRPLMKYYSATYQMSFVSSKVSE